MPGTRSPQWPYRGASAVAVLVAIAAACRPPAPAPAPEAPDRPARISFLTVPDGATVRLNGRPLVGTTPIEYESVEPGLNVVEVEMEGYQSMRLQRYWNPGAAERVDIVLTALATATPTATPEPTATAIVVVPAAVSAAVITPPRSQPPQTRAQILSPAATVPQVATVSFRSRPPGAAVIVNGTQLPGNTPIDKVALPAVESSIEIRLGGFQAVSFVRTWKGGAVDIVDADLSALPARVSFVSTPPGATVKVNGVVVEGQTPIESALVPAGDNEVTFELPDHVAYTARHEWKAEGEARVEATLVPLDAKVRFESDPPGATIVVNGTALAAKAPVGPLAMPPQQARIEFRLEGHSVVVVERTWAPNAVDSVLAKLTPDPGRARFESSMTWDELTVDGEPVVTRPGGWVPLLSGKHRALAVHGDQAAETDFEVPPAGDVVVNLDWTKKRPNPRDYVELRAMKAALGAKKFADTNPGRTVDVPAFWIARREVTVVEYATCVAAKRCEPAATTAGCNAATQDRATHPINCVSANDAAAYAAWLAEREGLPYRLPTVDEWERAARGEGDRIYPWGDDVPGARCNTCDKSCALEQFRDDTVNDSWPETAPAGALAYCTSAEGVVDLVGNVAEWCVGNASAERQQVRGGSWAQNGIFLEPALGTARPATDRDPTVGFRLAVSIAAALPSAPTPTSPAAPSADAVTPQAPGAGKPTGS